MWLIEPEFASICWELPVCTLTNLLVFENSLSVAFQSKHSPSAMNLNAGVVNSGHFYKPSRVLKRVSRMHCTSLTMPPWNISLLSPTCSMGAHFPTSHLQTRRFALISLPRAGLQLLLIR